jgi:hypothetical protein
MQHKFQYKFGELTSHQTPSLMASSSYILAFYRIYIVIASDNQVFQKYIFFLNVIIREYFIDFEKT